MNLVLQSFGRESEYKRAILATLSFYAFSSLPVDQTKVLLFTDQPEYFKKYFEDLVSKNITVVKNKDPDYPENLKLISDAPLVLYVRGSIKKSDQNAVAIVGSRKMTSYGKEVAEKFAKNQNSCTFDMWL